MKNKIISVLIAINMLLTVALGTVVFSFKSEYSETMGYVISSLKSLESFTKTQNEINEITGNTFKKIYEIIK